MVHKLRSLAYFLLAATLMLAPASLAHAWTQDGPASAEIHLRGSYITVDYQANDYDLLVGGDWADFSAAAHGQFVETPPATMAAYLRKSVTLSIGGKTLPGRLSYEHQRVNGTPESSTFEAVMRYGDQTTPLPSGPLTVTTTLFSFYKPTIVTFELAGDSKTAHVGVPITFPASETAQKLPTIVAEYLDLGFGAAIGSTCAWILAILVFAPLTEPKQMMRSIAIYCVGAGIGVWVAESVHLAVTPLVASSALLAAVAVTAVANFTGWRVGGAADSRVGNLVPALAGILGGIAFAQPLSLLGAPTIGSAFACDCNALGAMAGGLTTSIAATVIGVLIARDVARRVRTTPNAPLTMQRIIAVVAVVAAVYLDFMS